MLIGTEYRIESDTLQVVVSKRQVNRKTGAVSWRPIAYYPNLTLALKHLVDLEVRETELKDLRTVLATQAGLHRLLEGLTLPAGAAQR